MHGAPRRVSNRGDPGGRGATADAHRRLQRLQFAVGPHQYSALALNKDAWTGSVGERMPTSYQRIVTDQPLPSTASLRLSRAQRGLGLEADLQRAGIAQKVHEWADFASEYVQARSSAALLTSRRVAAAEVPDGHAQDGAAADGWEQPGRRVAPWKSLSSRSMFDQLSRQRSAKRLTGALVPALEQGTANHEHCNEEPSSTVQRTTSDPASPAPPRRLKTKLVKKNEMVETKNKRKAIWYNLPEGSSLVASDQSANAARISIMLTALAEEDARERTKVRSRLLQLYRVKGAVTEDKKAIAREALLSGDPEAAMKIIREAELQVAMMKMREEGPNSFLSSGPEPVCPQSIASTRGSTSSIFITQPSSHETCPQHTSAPSARPSTARPPSAVARLAVRERPATARPHVNEDASFRAPRQSPADEGASSKLSQLRQELNSPLGEHTVGFELDCHPKAAQSASCTASAHTANSHQGEWLLPATNGELEDAKDVVGLATLDEPVRSPRSGSGEPGDKKFKPKLKTEKQCQLANWLRLADDVEDAEVAETNDRIELPNTRLTEMPEFFLVPNMRVRTLNVRQNSIPSISDKFCAMLFHLEECNLGHNLLSSLPPTLGNLRSLKTLLVNSNRLRGLPFSIGSLTRLEALNIENNQITRLPSSMSTMTSLRNLAVRGNPSFVQPPQAIISGDSLDDVRSYLNAVHEAGLRSREEVWRELDTRCMTIPKLLAFITGTDIPPEWEVKKDGRPADLTFSKEHLEEKLRWALKVAKSRKIFKDLWEFLDENGDGYLTHRQFLYQMKKPLRRPVVCSFETQEVELDGSNSLTRCGKLDVTLSGSHMPKTGLFRDISTFCVLTQGQAVFRTNVAENSVGPRWTFQGRMPGVSLSSLELEIPDVERVLPLLVQVFDNEDDSADAEIGNAEISEEELKEIMGAGNGSEVELTYKLLSDRIARTSSGRATIEDKKPVRGADGQLASITLKFKPFIFETGEDKGAQLVRRGVVRQGIKGWVNAANKTVDTAHHGLNTEPRVEVRATKVYMN